MDNEYNTMIASNTLTAINNEYSTSRNKGVDFCIAECHHQQECKQCLYIAMNCPAIQDELQSPT